MECNFVLSAVDYILEGLAKALESERECGLRSVEIDRTLLKVEEKSAYPPSVSESRSDGYRGASPHPCSVQQPAASGQAQAMPVAGHNLDLHRGQWRHVAGVAAQDFQRGFS